MIPFAICGGRLFFNRPFAASREEEPDIENESETEKELEIRFLELAPEYCTFRLPIAISDSMTDQDLVIEKIRVRFGLNSGLRYIELDIEDFAIEPISTEKYRALFKLRTSNPQFSSFSKQLSHEYLDYVEARLSMDDAELSHHMTEKNAVPYPSCEDQFAENASDQLNIFQDWIQKAYESGDLDRLIRSFSSLPLGIALESGADCRKWLTLGHKEYYRSLLRYWFPIAVEQQLIKSTPRFLYLGNHFCPCQRTDIGILKKILKYNHIRPVLVLAPVSELELEGTIAYLEEAHSLAEKEDQVFEVLFNDEGMLTWLQEQKKKGYYPNFLPGKGILLNKKKRDARQKYLQSKPKDSDFSFGSQYGDTLYFPWYQMNTGTFCPLHAIVTKGNRGAAERITICEKYCEKTFLLYPKHLGMIGRFNSVFGFSLQAPDQHCHRIVISGFGGGL